MVQLNPVPAFGAKKNTSTIWRKFFTEIPVQMVSAPYANGWGYDPGVNDWNRVSTIKFTMLHRKRDVSKEPFKFILETSYRWIIKYWCFSCVSILALF